MEGVLVRHARRPGIGRLRAALKDYLPKPERRSGLECAFDRLIEGADVPPPRRNVRLLGWEGDRHRPEERLVVELDGGPYHRTVKDMERDKLKDTKLQQAGIGVMRVTGTRMEHEPGAVLPDVLALLELG